MEQFEKVEKGLSCHVYGHPHTRCHNCPYWGTGPHGSSECSVLAADALSLIWQQQERIKELEEAQMARVMTLEEIDSILTNSKEDHEKIFWVESKSRTRYSFGVFQLDYADDGDFEALLMGCSWPFHFRKGTYGITWRVWTTKPTDEQRKAVPWNERSSI